MAQSDGVCAVIPFGQQGFRPHVIGMGILLTDTEIATCTHVVQDALQLKFDLWPERGRVRVCFPFP